MKKASTDSTLPKQRIRSLARPLEYFLRIEAANGVVLVVCTSVALVLANSSWATAYHDFWQTHIGLSIGDWKLDHSLAHWVNDGLMTLFFFVVGLEIKRELVSGELRDPRQTVLPMVAALGGMVVPAGIFLLLQSGQPGERGWGIPMATDIAFVVGVLALLGKRVPIGLKVLLLALAIVDDIGEVPRDCHLLYQQYFYRFIAASRWWICCSTPDAVFRGAANPVVCLNWYRDLVCIPDVRCSSDSCGRDPWTIDAGAPWVPAPLLERTVSKAERQGYCRKRIASMNCGLRLKSLSRH